MSIQGDLNQVGIVPQFGGTGILFDTPVTFGAAVSNAMGAGKVYYCDPANGSDSNDGLTPGRAKASLTNSSSTGAYDKCTSGKNDVVVLIGDGSTSATARLTATLTWSKNATHLIGVTAPTYFASRARISHLTTATTNFKMMVVSGSGCIFSGFSFFQGIGEAATAETLIDVTGSRNLFNKVHFGGMGAAAGADVAGSYIMTVTGGENEFRDCVVGLDTIPRGAANSSVIFSSGALRNIFVNCIFPMYADTATTQLFINANSSGAFGGGLGALFKDCLFYAEANIGSATTPAAPVVAHASANGTIIFQNCGFQNVTKISAANALIRSVGMPSQAANQGVATNAAS